MASDSTKFDHLTTGTLDILLLPEELIQQCLAMLWCNELRACCIAGRRFRRFLQHDLLWKQHVLRLWNVRGGVGSTDLVVHSPLTPMLAFKSLAPCYPSQIDATQLPVSESHRVVVLRNNDEQDQRCLRLIFQGSGVGGDRCIRSDQPFPPPRSHPYTACVAFQGGVGEGRHLLHAVLCVESYYEVTIEKETEEGRLRHTGTPTVTVGT